MWGDIYLEKHVMGEQKFNEKVAGFSKITKKKNNEKINMEKFFNWKKRVALKLKTNRDYYVYEGF